MFNIKTTKKIFTFDALLKKRISAVCQTPHLHVIDVGTEDGTFALLSLKSNEIVLKVTQAETVTSAACRSDVPFVALGGTDGKVQVWDLENMQLISQVRDF